MPYIFKNINTWDAPQPNLQTQPLQNIYGSVSFDAIGSQPMNLVPQDRPLYVNPYESVNSMDFKTLRTGTVNPNGTKLGGQSSESQTVHTQAEPGFMDKVGATIGGISSLADTYMNLSEIADTSGYWNDINYVKNVGRSNYTDFDRLSQDYARMADMQQSFDYKDIRGKSDAELVGGVGSSILQGASAGAAYGPYGAAAGAVIGLGAGLAGVFSGNAKARKEQQWLEDNTIMAEHSATANLNAGQEQLREYQFRSGVTNRAAWGGGIERKTQSIRQFADKALHGKPRRASEVRHEIKRLHKDGGTMIRIKR